MIANSEILLFLLSKNGHILQINSKVENVLHYTPKEIQSKYFWEIIKNSDEIEKYFKSQTDIEVFNNNKFELITSQNRITKAKFEFTPHKNDLIICIFNLFK